MLAKKIIEQVPMLFNYYSPSLTLWFLVSKLVLVFGNFKAQEPFHGVYLLVNIRLNTSLFGAFVTVENGYNIDFRGGTSNEARQ